MSLKSKNISYIFMTNIVKEIVCVMAVSFEGLRTTLFPCLTPSRKDPLRLPDLGLTSEMLEDLERREPSNNGRTLHEHLELRVKKGKNSGFPCIFGIKTPYQIKIDKRDKCAERTKEQFPNRCT